MNFFKGKDPDISEVSREKRVKESIISELSACLKSIHATQQARRPGEPIYTSDSSNYLCNIMEAVFLHGHKSTRGIGRQHSDIKAFDRCSFWSFVQRFTHQDTISQLKRLAHIKTETGVCRAWIKLAINDGLMESYLMAILAQPNVLRQYYSRTAILRDLEQPDILLKLIKVLAAANYDFQLVYNSSQLNVWTMKTLALAGLVERQFVFDRGMTGSSSNPAPQQRSRSSTLDMDDFPFDFVSSKPKGVEGVSDGTPHSNLSSRHSSVDQSDVFDRLSENSSLSSEHKDHNIVSMADNPNEIAAVAGVANQIGAPTADPANQMTVSEGSLHRNPSKARIHDDLQTIGEEGKTTPEADNSSLSFMSSVDSGGGRGESASQRSQYDTAEKELARLRTAQYSISDIINMDSSPPSKPRDETVTVSNLKPSPADGTYTDLSPIGRTDNSGDISTVPDLEKHSSLAEDLVHDNLMEETYDSSPIIDMHSKTTTDGTRAIMTDQSEELAVDSKINFVVGTPQFKSEFLTSHEQAEPENVDVEDEIFESSYLREETTSDADARNPDVEESPYSKYPFSAAQAILSKRPSGAGSPASSLNKQTVNSNSLGTMSHGNSLASLTGWGNVEEKMTSQASLVDLVQGPSFADMVSEHQQTGDILLGSPNRDYAAVSTVLKAAGVNTATEAAGDKNVPEGDAVDSAVSETTTSARSSRSVSRSTSPDVDGDFEVIGSMTKDVLLRYGKLHNEEGLDAQDYKCSTCSAPIGIIFGAPRVCAYTKQYYCLQCHVNEESYIPAKIIYNWDFSRYKVCKHSKDFLSSAESMPLLNVKVFNPRLYEHVPAMDTYRLLRTQLFYLKRYLFACNPTVADQLKQKFWPHEYLYEEIHTYTIQDLVSANTSNSLSNLMKKNIKYARKHVEGCESCEYRGFLCEICSSARVIFPFDLDTTSTCERCNGVYHKACLTSDCPKCERIRQRDVMLGRSVDERPVNDDYSLPHL